MYLLSRTAIFLTNVSAIESYKESKIISVTTQRILRLKVRLSLVEKTKPPKQIAWGPAAVRVEGGQFCHSLLGAIHFRKEWFNSLQLQLRDLF